MLNEQIKHIKPVDRVEAVVNVPPSKSLTNRALIIAALAEGTSRIKNYSKADDCLLMIDALKKFGIKVQELNNDFIVQGTSGNLIPGDNEIYVGNAGTTMRFLAGFATLKQGKTKLIGSERMNQRPISDLLYALEQLGIKIETTNGYPPITISGGEIKGGNIIVDASISSQFISSVLLISPYAETDVKIILKGNIISKPYIDMTIGMMRYFGVEVIEEEKSYFIKNNQTYKSREYLIEADATSASYFFAAAAITGGKVSIKNLSSNTNQGDIYFLKILEMMGCAVEITEKMITVIGGNLKGIEIDMKEVPDLVPTVAVISLFANGKTLIKNVPHLRYKESDRLRVLKTELTKLGGKVKELVDGLEIIPSNYSGVQIDTYDDHRIAMSFALAGLRIACVSIKNPDCVSKSFPNFWDEWEKLEKY